MLYLLAEKKFKEFSWYAVAYRSIYEESRKKRITVQSVDSADQIPDTDREAAALLLGGTQEWLCSVNSCLKSRGIVGILLSAVSRYPDRATANWISTDLADSMDLAVRYLHSLGREKLALYGVNPDSGSDPYIEQHFISITGRREHIYPVDGSFRNTFENFRSHIREYDGVLCVNDYSAVSLVRHLREAGVDPTRELYVIAYGNMKLTAMCSPTITTITDDFDNYGRAAVAAYHMLIRQNRISVVQIQMRSRLYIRQTTGNRPWIRENQEIPAHPSKIPNLFYDDPEVADLASLEVMLSQCDETDLTILKLLMQGDSYTAIAEKCFISESAAKYRVKKMEALCGVNSREQLKVKLKYLT